MAKTVKQKEINFLTVLSGRSAKKKLTPRSLIMPGVVLLIILIGCGIFALFSAYAYQIHEESASIREYLDSPDTVRQLSEAESIASQAQTMATKSQRIAQAMNNIATYPDLTSEDYKRIHTYASVTITLYTMSYDRTTGILSFTAASDYVSAIPAFISQLRTSGIFADVNYSGYAGNVTAASQLATSTNRTGTLSTSSPSSSANTTTKTLYAFSVECSVKPPNQSVAETEEEE